MSAAAGFEPRLTPLPRRRYVLLVSGTFNPPHKGHVRLGLHAAAELRAEGHDAIAICFVPVHDNYLHNKLASSGSPSLLLPMSQRCGLLRALIQADAGVDADVCHVVDYETDHAAELLEPSPAYWAQKLPHGYLHTVPTATLIRHFAENHPLLSGSAAARLAVAFGVDNFSAMASWNAPETLLARADVALVARVAECVTFAQDPTPLLAPVASVEVHAMVPVVFEQRKLFGDRLGSFAQSGATADATVWLLPALDGDDEALSSTAMRKAMASCLVQLEVEQPYTSAADIGRALKEGDDALLNVPALRSCLQTLLEHGYSPNSAATLFQSVHESSQRLCQLKNAACARGELVVCADRRC